jgi:predicted double-glycine peptidase
MTALLASLLLAAASLDVPFLPQAEALCGGAATAMVFRYWGDAHADARQFEPLVDRNAGGIRDAVLLAEIRRRGWRTLQFSGTVERLAAETRSARPVIVLIEDRPGRFHYLVVTGVNGENVVVHDPARGPLRRMAVDDFLRAWRPTRYWSLLILPAVPELIEGRTQAPPSSPKPNIATASGDDRCELMRVRAVEDAPVVGLERTGEALDRIRDMCPDSSAVLRELAAVKFAQRRWADSSALAERAVALGDTDPYVWEVLASSRYMQDDSGGALAAWNQIGKPLVNIVRIHGIQRTRYPIVDQMLSLPVNSLLTEQAFRRAERRLLELPDRLTARLTYRLERDGYATVDVALVERPTVPEQPAGWAVAAARSAVEREARIVVPGSTGQGEIWSASWRWWPERPRAAVSFAAPRFGRVPGIWRVDAGWEQQAYATDQGAATQPPFRESHAFGRLSASDWATPELRYQWKLGLDSWNGVRRATSVGADLDRRLLNDRLSISGGGTVWIPLTSEPGFKSIGAQVTIRSSPTSGSNWGFVADAGADIVTSAAPVSMWPAAGDSQTLARLMRAHPLFDRGVASGPLIGHQLAFGNVEVRRWLDSKLPLRLGAAAFADFAHAWERTPSALGRPFHADVGGGLRIKVPGYEGTLRVDFGHGLRDGANAVTVGWQF